MLTCVVCRKSRIHIFMNAVSQRNTLEIVVANRVGGEFIILNVRTGFKKSFLIIDMCNNAPSQRIHSNCSRKQAIKTIRGSSRVLPTFDLT